MDKIINKDIEPEQLASELRAALGEGIGVFIDNYDRSNFSRQDIKVTVESDLDIDESQFQSVLDNHAPQMTLEQKRGEVEQQGRNAQAAELINTDPFIAVMDRIVSLEERVEELESEVASLKRRQP